MLKKLACSIICSILVRTFFFTLTLFRAAKLDNFKFIWFTYSIEIFHPNDIKLNFLKFSLKQEIFYLFSN